MADKPKTPAARTRSSKPTSGLPAGVLKAADDVMAASQDAAAPVPKKARRRIRKLGQQLDTVRATEAKRRRQSAKAQQLAEKRERQAADAAAEMTTIIGRIRDEAGDAVATPASSAKSRQAVKPARANKSATATTKPAGTTKPARATTKPARTPKPAAATTKPAAATTKPARPTTKPATTAKAASRSRKPTPSA